MSLTRILVVDDEAPALELLQDYLTERGYHVECAVNGQECLEKNASFAPQVVVLDIRLPDMDGLDILQELNGSANKPPVIMVTAFHDMATTIRAMKRGAFEYIPKPIDVDDLEAAIERALEVSRRRQGRDGLLIGASRMVEPGELIGRTRAMKEIFKTIGLLAGNRVNVLIEGETGTGKELVARAIHIHSARKGEPFIPVNCSAIVQNLMESELFGHERGAFTSAVSLRKGKVELAGNGTILLDEVGEIPLELQAKLLRFLQEKEFQRVGGEQTLRSGARVIAATNRNLVQMAREGTFREDLYYRLRVAKITMPPLRERKEDIPAIVDHLMQRINRDLQLRIKRVEERALRRMMEHHWPGNVRELENLLTSAALNTRGDTLLDRTIEILLGKGTENPVPDKQASTSDVRPPAESEKDLILRTLETVKWHYGNACRELGISRPTLNKKMKSYGILSKPHGHSDS